MSFLETLNAFEGALDTLSPTRRFHRGHRCQLHGRSQRLDSNSTVFEFKPGAFASAPTLMKATPMKMDDDEAPEEVTEGVAGPSTKKKNKSR